LKECFTERNNTIERYILSHDVKVLGLKCYPSKFALKTKNERKKLRFRPCLLNSGKLTVFPVRYKLTRVNFGLKTVED
jgi:hypothetical protein